MKEIPAILWALAGQGKRKKKREEEKRKVSKSYLNSEREG